MSNPKVSVLMPVFNSEPFLAEAIESILAQTMTDFEFIIIDDGSTDHSDAILKRYREHDNRIKTLKNTKNMGIVYSLNRGLAECSGEYIARMDADDVSLKDRLKIQTSTLDANPDICALGGALSYINSKGNDLGLIRYCEPTIKPLTKTPLLHPTVVIRRQILCDNNLSYNQKYCYAEDYFLWLQLSKFGTISAVRDVVLKYRLNKQAIKVKKLKDTIIATLKVKRDAVLKLNITPTIKDCARAFAELILLLMPSSVILFLYLKITFPGKKSVDL